MAKIKEKRRKKRILRRVWHLCVFLAVLFAVSRGISMLGEEPYTAIGQAVGNTFLHTGKEKQQKEQTGTGEVAEVLAATGTYREEYLKALENNPELIDFVRGSNTAQTVATGGIRKKELGEDIPLLIQWDERWGYVPYGDHNIGLSGCAPTCLSMVVVGLTKNAEASPDAVAAFAQENGYYLYGTGTKWSLMTEGAEHFGVRGQQIALDQDRIFSALEQGRPVICSVRPGDFTTGGHFLVLTGVEDGKIRLNDPNSRIRSGQLWDYEVLAPQIKSLWEFQSL